MIHEGNEWNVCSSSDLIWGYNVTGTNEEYATLSPPILGLTTTTARGGDDPPEHLFPSPFPERRTDRRPVLLVHHRPVRIA